MSLKNKVAVITGGSRGIGESIALALAKAGVNVAIMAKTAEPHPKLSGTIYTVAQSIEALGAQALPLAVDVRDENRIQQAIDEVAKQFGQIDFLINNASAISLTPTTQTPMKKFDLMQQVNARATFACSQACLPYLAKAQNPHILNLSPPLNMAAKWFKDHVAYTISKYGMSMCTLGMSEEFKSQGVAVNSLWPKTTIATAAIENHFPPEIYRASRKPEIMSDSALIILQKPSRQFTGQFCIDEDILRETGVTDFSRYALDSTQKQFFPDLFLG